MNTIVESGPTVISITPLPVAPPEEVRETVKLAAPSVLVGVTVKVQLSPVWVTDWSRLWTLVASPQVTVKEPSVA